MVSKRYDLIDCIILSTNAAPTNKKVMPPSTVATRLGVHHDHHDDRRKNGNASKAGSAETGGNVSKAGSARTGGNVFNAVSDETGAMTIIGVSSGFSVMAVVGKVDCRSFTGVTVIGSSRNSSVPVDVRREDRGEEGLPGTTRKASRSSFFNGESGSATLDISCP